MPRLTSVRVLGNGSGRPFQGSRLGAAFLCGAALALCFPRPGLCFLAWFSLAPLFALWSRSPDWKDSSRLGYAAGIGFHGVSLYWVFSTCRFAGLNVGLCLLAWTALAGLLGFNWGAIGALGRRFNFKSPFAWAALWTAVTFATEHWTPRLTADVLGYTQYRHLSLLQISSIAGPHALGFLILASNASLAQVWLALEAGENPAAFNMALTLASLGAVWGFGKYEMTARELRPAPPTVRVEILQPAIDQYRKWDSNFQTKILADFEDLLSRPRTVRPDLIVWPESALPMVVRPGQDLPLASAWSRRLGARQLVGVVDQDADGLHSSAFLLGPDGGVEGAYHKRELVPFGEYIPFLWLKAYIGILNELGGMTAGKPAQPLLNTPLGPTAASICYEAVFPRWSQRDAFRGARVFINITNDGWYKDTWGPYQHFRTNVFRAVENRATVVRAANTGISAVIDPWGAVTAKLDLNERGRLDADVPRDMPFPRGSFYSRHGDWFGRLCLAATLLLSLA